MATNNIGDEIPIRESPFTNDYEELDEPLGVGRNGKVVKCRNRISNRICALKVIKDCEKARREVILHKKASKNCEYIVQIWDIYSNIRLSNRCLFIIMECMEGGELFNRIAERQTNPYNEGDAKRFISMIVKSVEHLHSMNIAHRDLKPENILFSSKKSDSLLKLTDFGFAKEANNEDKPLKTPCFTAYYVAPEILSQNKYDKACDIWSLGVIIYILLCGYPPFYSSHGNDLTPGMKKKIRAGQYEFDKEHWKDISDQSIQTIKSMLIVDPTKRININQINNSSWLRELKSSRLIDISSIQDQDDWIQIQSEFSSANDNQRRIDDEDLELDILIPETSRISRRRAENKNNKN